METFKGIAIFVLLVYVAICVLLFVFQRRFIYYPMQDIEPFEHYSLAGFEEVSLKTKDGVEIFAWYRKPAAKNIPVILLFHGNGGNLSHRLGKILTFANYKNYGIMAIDYRGYGRSAGKPSEQGLYKDGRAALDYLNTQGVSKDKIILYGESLGTAVATKMAEERGARMLVLEAPFISAVKAGQDAFPLFPVRLLLSDRYDTISIIPSLKMPILIIYGEYDQVIKPRHSHELYDRVTSKKRIIEYEGKGHNDLDPELIIKEIVEFDRK